MGFVWIQRPPSVQVCAHVRRRLCALCTGAASALFCSRQRSARGAGLLICRPDGGSRPDTHRHKTFVARSCPRGPEPPPPPSPHKLFAPSAVLCVSWTIFDEKQIFRRPVHFRTSVQMLPRPSGCGRAPTRCRGGGVSRSPDGLFAQQEREPNRGRPAGRGKGTYGGRPGQRVEEQGTRASRTQKHSEAGYGRPVDRGAWTAQTVKRPRQQPAQPPIRQPLGAADAQTAHPATFSTAPTHQLLGSVNAETTPA